jgi:NADH dehydrogenase [ubiquinone] 1 alpha subcomplex assembly factor 1
MTTKITLYNFNSNTNPADWMVVNDGVMGGLSEGYFKVNDAGHGIFEGEVSLENNGGFSSIRHRLNLSDINPKGTVVIRLKGDGKNYQFRIKAKNRDYHSYQYTFSTSGKWQEVEIPLTKFTPTFRGMKPNLPNFDKNTIQEIGFLIANKKEESFRLEIDSIHVE